jgi:hypothetical protein
VTQPVLHWFRQDLRLGDNPAVAAAVASGPVIPVYVQDDRTPGRWAAGSASRWWLHHSLDALGRGLAERGAPLVLRQGQALRVLADLVRETGARAVFWTRCYEPHAATLDVELVETLAAEGVSCRRFGGNLLYETEAIATAEDRPFRVFTPFWRACMRHPSPKGPCRHQSGSKASQSRRKARVWPTWGCCRSRTGPPGCGPNGPRARPAHDRVWRASSMAPLPATARRAIAWRSRRPRSSRRTCTTARSVRASAGMRQVLRSRAAARHSCAS